MSVNREIQLRVGPTGRWETHAESCPLDALDGKRHSCQVGITAEDGNLGMVACCEHTNKDAVFYQPRGKERVVFQACFHGDNDKLPGNGAIFGMPSVRHADHT